MFTNQTSATIMLFFCYVMLFYAFLQFRYLLFYLFLIVRDGFFNLVELFFHIIIVVCSQGINKNGIDERHADDATTDKKQAEG